MKHLPFLMKKASEEKKASNNNSKKTKLFLIRIKMSLSTSKNTFCRCKIIFNPALLINLLWTYDKICPWKRKTFITKKGLAHKFL